MSFKLKSKKILNVLKSVNMDQLLGSIRHTLSFAGGTLVTKGLISSDMLMDYVGIIVALFALGWSLVIKYESAPDDTPTAPTPTTTGTTAN